MSREIGIDLGTSNVLIHLKGHGIILNEPAVVALDTKTREIVAVGREAYDMIGRAPASIEIVRPIKKGVISDFDVAEAMLVVLLERLNIQRWFSRPNVLICSPAKISDIERISLVEVAEKASNGRIFLEDEARVAAVGAGVDYFDPSSYMMIDIGGGTCDIAVISSGEMIVSETLKLAGDDFDAAIIQYFKEHHQLLIGERTAEAVKKQLATAIFVSPAEMLTQAVKGRDLLTGLPKSINAHSNQMYEALKPLIEQIARVVKRVLEDLPPEIAADIAGKGIILTGGGALIYQLDTFLTKQLKVSVIRSDQPLNSVGLGTGLMLDLILSGKLERTNPTWKQKFRRWLRRWRRRIIG
ncbi:rod shape-determining protein [Aerococcaceae bacterium NML191292]|nr:rod shape-determining protein [Aerococcaceae bacterium NML210727]MCW6654243.1 rod shape-determining protein [Aerococcaceae bacterium NML201296]MCW6660215.1 rod shape-determining protein [Aerococcaceae bacterium NML191292]MCW6663593.1 rod shape-determining protein [Aerococcaceae bacterium NML190073]MCW6667027.1 rod shape-determining protein [Aerococcaceae bacterium NML190938]